MPEKFSGIFFNLMRAYESFTVRFQTQTCISGSFYFFELKKFNISFIPSPVRHTTLFFNSLMRH
jgi:hypothetical protein